MSIDVEYDVFWLLSPNKLKPFSEAHKLKEKIKNKNMWIHGLYIRSAVASVLSDKNKYVEEPIDFSEKTEEELEEEAEMKWELWALQVNANTVLHDFSKE